MTTTLPLNTISRFAPKAIIRRLALPAFATAVAISSIAAAVFNPQAPAAAPIAPVVSVTVPITTNTAKPAAPAAAPELMHDAVTALPPQHIPTVRIVMMEVTAYCPCPKCCGPKAAGITASGKAIGYNEGRFVAADSSLPFGTKLVIPGYSAGQQVEVIDRGGAIKGNKLDVFFATHTEALKWGRRHIAVTVIE